MHIHLPATFTGPWLDNLIDGCIFDHLQEKYEKKTVKELSGLKNDGCMPRIFIRINLKCHLHEKLGHSNQS